MTNKIKKATSIAIATLITVGSTGTYAASFNDISKHWAKSFIEEGKSLNLISGYDDGSFRPESSISRIQTIAMAARILDLSAAETQKTRAKYESVLSANRVPEWARDNFSVALDKGIIKESVLSELFNDNGAESLSKREEVIIYLARAIGLEKQAENKGSNVVLSFKDSKNIAEAAKPYVSVMNEKGIILGDELGNLNPKAEIKRSEMAVLLSKSYKYLAGNKNNQNDEKKDEIVKSVSGVFDNIFTGGNKTYIVVEDNIGNKTSYEIDGQTIINIDQYRVTHNELVKGLQVNLEVASSGEVDLVKKIDGKTVVEQYEGVISYLSDKETTLRIEEKGTKNEKMLILDSNVEILLDEKKSEYKDLREKDTVKLEVKNGRVVKIDAQANIRDLEGVLKDKITTDEIKFITVADKNGEQTKYELHKDVKIERDSRVSELSSLRKGDKIEIRVENKKVLRIDAKKVESVVSGSIVKKSVGYDVDEITVLNSKTKKEEMYQIPKEVRVLLDGKRARLDELELGYNVELSLEGEEVIDVKGQLTSVINKHLGEISYVGVTYLEMVLDKGTARESIIRVEVGDTPIKDSAGNTIVSIGYLVKGDAIVVTGKSYRPGEIVADEIMKLAK